MKNNKLKIFFLSILLIYLEVFVLNNFNFLYNNEIQIQLLLPFLVAIVWNARNARNFKIFNFTNILLLLIILIETYFGTYLGIFEYLIAFLLIIYIEETKQDLNQITSISILIIIYSLVKIGNLTAYTIYFQEVPNIDFQYMYIQTLEVFVNISLTLFFHKILHHRYKLLYN